MLKKFFISVAFLDPVRRKVIGKEKIDNISYVSDMKMAHYIVFLPAEKIMRSFIP